MAKKPQKVECDMKCTDRSMCKGCGWNPAEDERRKEYIAKHGLTAKKDHSRGLVLSKMRRARCK